MSNDLTQARQLIRNCLETQNPYLDIGNCGITDLNDLPELFECTHLETLIVSNTWLDGSTLKESVNRGIKNQLTALPASLKNSVI